MAQAMAQRGRSQERAGMGEGVGSFLQGLSLGKRGWELTLDAACWE